MSRPRITVRTCVGAYAWLCPCRYDL